MGHRLVSSDSKFGPQSFGPPSFGPSPGCSRALVNGRWVFIPGTTGIDHATRSFSDDVEEQTRQTMRNLRAVLRKSDADLADVVRVRVYLADSADFPRVAPILVEQFEGIGAASTTLECPLSDPRMKIEIEVTARR